MFCAVHAAALMRTALIVTDKEVVENGLHLVDRLEPSAPAFDAKVLVEQALELRRQRLDQCSELLGWRNG